jgi:predicted nuclease with TOPRIM domain
MSVDGISLQHFNNVNHQIIDLTRYSIVWGYPKNCHHNVIIINENIRHEYDRNIASLFNSYVHNCKLNRLTTNSNKADGLLRRINELEQKNKQQMEKFDQQSKDDSKCQEEQTKLKDKINEIQSFNKKFKIKLSPCMKEFEIDKAYSLLQTCNKIIKNIENINNNTIHDEELTPEYIKSLMLMISYTFKEISMFNSN